VLLKATLLQGQVQNQANQPVISGCFVPITFLTKLTKYCILNQVKTMQQNKEFILGFISCPDEQLLKNESVLKRRLSTFLALYKENPQAAQGYCSEKNLEQDIRLTAKNFLDQEPFEVFGAARIELVNCFEQDAKVAAAAREELSKKRTAIHGVCPEAIDELISSLSVTIAYCEQVVMYLQLYPLIIKHPGED
jgi:hypothetical protein